MKPLSKRQRQMLDFISDYICQRGYPPSIREIADEMEIKSTNGVAEHLEHLYQKGYLLREEGDRSRARAMRPKHLPTVPFGAIQVPIIQDMKAEMPQFASETPKKHFCFDRSMVDEHRDVFAWRMPDQSMQNRGIQEGDYVLANRTTRVQDGDLVIALVGEEAACRCFYQSGRQIRLQPAHDDFDTLYLPKAPFMESTIMGIVIGLYRTL